MPRNPCSVRPLPLCWGVRAGVADTAEQVHYLEQVAALELEIQTLRAAEIKARLRMVGMCEARKMRPIDDYLEHFNQLR